jgi:hypothetical protein
VRRPASRARDARPVEVLAAAGEVTGCMTARRATQLADCRQATEVRSASRKIATICSSLNRLFLIGSSFRLKSHLSRNQPSEKAGQVRQASLAVGRIAYQMKLAAQSYDSSRLNAIKTDRGGNLKGCPGPSVDVPSNRAEAQDISRPTVLAA